MSRKAILLFPMALLLAAAPSEAAEKTAPAGRPAVTRRSYEIKDYKKLRGTIDSVDPDRRKLTITTLDGKTVPLTAGKNVRIFDFQKGDAVRIDAKGGVAVIMSLDPDRQKIKSPKAHFRGH